jgi:TetR/AcrR family transcriptional regulator, regulator of biofilm formation and stress response
VTAASVDGRRLRGERARRALIEATLAVIERSGVAGVTHRAVTREAGLPSTSAAYHFARIDDLLEASLLHADQAAADALARCAADPDPVRALADWVAAAYRADSARLTAEYELYLYAARTPSMRPAAARWLTDLGALVAHWTTDRRRQRAVAAYVDGVCIQSLVTGEQPDADEVAVTIRSVLAS